MRRITTAFMTCLLMVSFANSALAQDDITDADLKDYAIILMAQKSITDKISPMVNDLIAKQDGMTGKRFQELRKGEGEPAQEWETSFLNVVNGQIKKKQDAAKSVVSTLAKGSLGAKKYSAIKKALKADSAMKAKVDAMVAAVNGAA
ncbi:MAG: hypothetical protein R8G66_19770 [Cytophagales bacterium]|nr:hypothetical protein [Cytophagales bacterium]